MELKPKDIAHIARLARLKLSEAEEKIYGRQLSGVLEYVEHLKNVDTAGIEPTAQVTGITGALRGDEVETRSREAAAALKEAPATDDGQIRVKRVLASS